MAVVILGTAEGPTERLPSTVFVTSWRHFSKLCSTKLLIIVSFRGPEGMNLGPGVASPGAEGALVGFEALSL